MTSATIAPVDGGTDFWGTTASQMQSGVTVTGNQITGTLTKLTSGALVDGWGEGYFLGLGFDNFSTGVTYSDVQVGLNPSVSSGFVTLDSDKMGVFKITDKKGQKLGVIQTKGDTSRTDYYDLSGLTLA